MADPAASRLPRRRVLRAGVCAAGVRELDVDGYRFDAAWGIRERSPDAWPQLLAELRRVKPDALLLAGASARDAYYGETGFDLAYDWTDELGVWAWTSVFAEPDGIVERLDAALGGSPSATTFRFLNNNDTGTRFLDRYGPGLTRVAAALLMTLPGVPGVYCGEEVGASLDPYETYQPIDWSTNPDVRAWYTQLIAVRAELPALRSATYVRLAVTPAADVLAFQRGPVRVLLNFADRPVSAVVDPPAAGPLVDRLTGAVLRPGPVELPAYGAAILSPPA